MQDSLHYIREHFLPLEALPEVTGCTADEIEAFIRSACLPDRAYETQESVTLRSGISELSDTRSTRYFPYSHIEKLKALKALAGRTSHREISRQLKQQFSDGYSAAYQQTDLGLSAAELAALVKEEWLAYLEGTYGLCTRTAIARDIARKEIAIRQIRRLTDEGNRPVLTSEARGQLQYWVKELDTVSMPFAPHERAQSSRRRWVEDMVNRYQLDYRPTGT